MTTHPIEKLLRSLRRVLGIRESRSNLSLQSKLYTAFLEFITFGRGIPRAINGEPEIRLVPMCRFLSSSYEPDVWNWLKQRTVPGSIILDVGAQFGLYSMLAARHIGAEGRVFAFEPSPETVAVLRRHLTNNGMTDRVEIVQAAVGPEEGEVTFYMAGTHPSNTLAPTTVDPVKLTPVKVKAITVDGFCRQRQLKPTILKIDVEGWELQVLRGATEVVQDPALTICVEMHPYAWESAGYTAADFTRFVEANGFEIVPLTGQSSPLTEYGEVWLKRK
ncbi:MAG: FkbM family methyltransferase [Verrucomicrobiaceae bacterium]|nr:FkbM family methyltransferase [Verrucomicrobiaceae bacterium]